MKNQSGQLLSVIVPVKDEEGSLPKFYQELLSVIAGIKIPYEIIFIDDGSVDKSLEIIHEFQKKNKKIKVITFRGNFGKSAALNEGFIKAKGNTVVTIDADLQDDPHEIPAMLKKLHQGYDMVCGWRKTRNDSISKKISSFLFNRGTVFISGVKLHDFNGGLKAYRKNVVKELYLHGELHRFIPILASKQKFKVTEIPVNHRARKYGKSKFGFERSWRGMIDLLTIVFITDYSSKPAHFYGKIGFVLGALGTAICSYLAIVRILTGSIQSRFPLLLLGILLIILGVQFLCTGLIAELIVHFQMRQKQSSNK